MTKWKANYGLNGFSLSQPSETSFRGVGGGNSINQSGDAGAEESKAFKAEEAMLPTELKTEERVGMESSIIDSPPKDAGASPDFHSITQIKKTFFPTLSKEDTPARASIICQEGLHEHCDHKLRVITWQDCGCSCHKC